MARKGPRIKKRELELASRKVDSHHTPDQRLSPILDLMDKKKFDQALRLAINPANTGNKIAQRIVLDCYLRLGKIEKAKEYAITILEKGTKAYEIRSRLLEIFYYYKDFANIQRIWDLTKHAELELSTVRIMLMYYRETGNEKGIEEIMKMARATKRIDQNRLEFIYIKFIDSENNGVYAFANKLREKAQTGSLDLKTLKAGIEEIMKKRGFKVIAELFEDPLFNKHLRNQEIRIFQLKALMEIDPEKALRIANAELRYTKDQYRINEFNFIIAKCMIKLNQITQARRILELLIMNTNKREKTRINSIILYLSTKPEITDKEKNDYLQEIRSATPEQIDDYETASALLK